MVEKTTDFPILCNKNYNIKFILSLVTGVKILFTAYNKSKPKYSS